MRPVVNTKDRKGKDTILSGLAIHSDDIEKPRTGNFT